MNNWKILLGAAALLAGSAQADGGAAEVLRTATINGALAGVTETVPQTDVPDILVRLVLANESGKSWAALDIRMDVLGYTTSVFQPSTLADSIRFGMAIQPHAVWRDMLELRINDVYVGKPGGNWEVSFAQATEVMQVRFIEPWIRPGDRVEVRFPVSDSGVQLWRIHAEARE